MLVNVLKYRPTSHSQHHKPHHQLLQDWLWVSAVPSWPQPPSLLLIRGHTSEGTLLNMTRICAQFSLLVYPALITLWGWQWRGIFYMREMSLHGRRVKSGWK